MIFMPMIDLSQKNPTCTFATLHFVNVRYGKNDTVPVLTLHQPLYWKVLNIIEAKSIGSPLKRIVLLLGQFHARMSLLAATGHLMQASGLQEILELIYAPSTVKQILARKADSRAIRASAPTDFGLVFPLTWSLNKY